MQMTDLRAIRGVSECDLTDEIVASLPASAPPAPWDATCTAIMWGARAPRAAVEAAGVEVVGAGKIVAVIGGFVSYSSTPVGTYHEVLGAVGVRNGRAVVGTVPFMAVDLVDSLVGGRANWALPKTLASFTGEPASGAALSARGPGWTVRAKARVFGPPLPAPMKGRIAQVWPDGIVRASQSGGKARMSMAVVNLEVESTGNLAEWLRPGRHLGVLMKGSFNLSEATPL